MTPPRSSNRFFGLYKNLFKALSGILFLILFSPLSQAAEEPPVWIILGVHGSAKTSPALTQHYANQSAKTITDALQKSNIPSERPLIIWFENGAPSTLGYSFTEPERFFKEIETRTGIPYLEFQTLLLNPNRSDPREVEKANQILRTIFNAHQSQIASSGALDNVRPKVFRSWLQRLEAGREVFTQHEEAPFESWLAELRSAGWEVQMFQEIAAGDLEVAMISKLRKEIMQSENVKIRDKKLAEDIKRVQTEHPKALTIVIRGAAHERLNEDLKQLGVSSRNIYSVDSDLIAGAMEFWRQHESRKDLFDKGFELNPGERNYLIQEIMYELLWKYLLEKDPEIFQDQPRQLLLRRTATHLSFSEMKTWQELVLAKAGDLNQQAEASWMWLIEKEPGLAPAEKP